MLKLLGLGIVIGACVGLGFVLANELKIRVGRLMECRQMFLMLQGEIKYAKTPLTEGFAKVGRRMEEPFRSFLLSLSEELEERNGKSLSEVFSEGVDRDLAACGLLKEDLDRLKDVGGHLGYLDVEMQIRTIDLYMEQLNSSFVEAGQEYKNKAKVYHCLGVMGGLFLAIIFI